MRRRHEAWNFIKKTLQQRCFPMKFVKFLRTPTFTEHLRWLLMKKSFFQVFIWRHNGLKLVSNNFLLSLIWFSWFHCFFCLTCLIVVSFYLLICFFLLKLLLVSFLSTITVTKELDSESKDSNIRNLWLSLFPILISQAGKDKLGPGQSDTKWGQKLGPGPGTGKHNYSTRKKNRFNSTRI